MGATATKQLATQIVCRGTHKQRVAIREPCSHLGLMRKLHKTAPPDAIERMRGADRRSNNISLSQEQSAARSKPLLPS